MPTLELPHARIAYSDDDQGGEPILLVHGSLSADWFALVGRALSRLGYRVILLHRAGYGDSEDLGTETTVADYAEHCVEVLNACGVSTAHVVGHSSGADIALQLAFGHPDLVSSLILLEPAFPFAPDEPPNTSAREAGQAARDGDFDRAFDIFLTGACGPNYQELFLRQLGEDGLSCATASANYFFTTEASAFRTWTCTRAYLASVRSPVLLVVGGAGQRLGTPHLARSKNLAHQLPDSRVIVLPKVSHAMPLECPALIAHTIDDFVATHRYTTVTD